MCRVVLLGRLCAMVSLDMQTFPGGFVIDGNKWLSWGVHIVRYDKGHSAVRQTHPVLKKGTRGSKSRVLRCEMLHSTKKKSHYSGKRKGIVE
jgi:hypothetical protein